MFFTVMDCGWPNNNSRQIKQTVQNIAYLSTNNPVREPIIKISKKKLSTITFCSSVSLLLAVQIGCHMTYTPPWPLCHNSLNEVLQRWLSVQQLLQYQDVARHQPGSWLFAAVTFNHQGYCNFWSFKTFAFVILTSIYYLSNWEL